MSDHGQSITSLAMRCLLIVQRIYKREPHFLLRMAANEIMRVTGISRASAWRYARHAVDALAVPYDDDPLRAAERHRRRAGGAALAHQVMRSRVLSPVGRPAGDGGRGGDLASDD